MQSKLPVQSLCTRSPPLIGNINWCPPKRSKVTRMTWDDHDRQKPTLTRVKNCYIWSGPQCANISTLTCFGETHLFRGPKDWNIWNFINVLHQSSANRKHVVSIRVHLRNVFLNILSYCIKVNWVNSESSHTSLDLSALLTLEISSLVAEFGSVDPVDLVVATCLVVAPASLDSKSLVVAVVAWALPMWMAGLVGLVSWNTLELGGCWARVL